MKSRVIPAAAIIAAMVCAIMSGCSASRYEPGAAGPTGSPGADTGAAAESQIKDDAVIFASVDSLESGTDGIGKKDLDASWDVSESTTVTLDGISATASGEGAAVSGNTVTITAAGTYVLSGTLSNGQIVIDAAKDDNVRLVLNGADITADKNAAVYAVGAKKLIVILAEGTVNKLTDSGPYVYADTEKEEPDATLFAECDLTINGTGTLIVGGNFKNAVKTKDDLVIVSGTFIVNAANNGLHAKDSVMIAGGRFDITSGNDGVKSSSGEKKGRIEIRGGVFDIKAECDGISAETELSISGGDFNVITGGGSANAPVRSGRFGGMGGMRPGSSRETTAAAETASKKGLKAKNTVYIADGSFVIDAYDDAVHSNNEIIIAGGSFEIKTGDDGIHADVSVLVTGGDIDVVQSNEGIEGMTVTITGGRASVVAGDDGINASDGEGKALNGGRPTFGASENVHIRIAGGTVDVYGGADGIDSNGHIYMEGGTLKVSGPSQEMEGAIDLDGTFLITGGEIISAGSWHKPSGDSAQPSILVSYTTRQTSGSVIAIKNPAGDVILEYTSKTSFSISGFTSPQFKIGETYSLYIDGEKRTDIKLNGNITTISDAGGAYSGGTGGPGGGRPDRGRR